MSNSVLNSALKQASRELGVDYKMVELVYRSYWKFIKEHVSSIVLRDMTKEEFDSVITNFNIPYLGKLYVVYDRIENFKRKQKIIQDVKAENDKASRLPSISD